MKNLLYKEWKLVVIPVVYAFMALAFLLFVPGYPYTVVVFYNCLGIFLSMVTARENKDVQYMTMLPVAKEDIVKSRYLLVILIEMLQILLCAVIAVFVLIGAAEASVHIAAAVNGSCFWDSVQAADQLRQLPILAAGILVFAAMTAVRYRVDVRHFKVQDL